MRYSPDREEKHRRHMRGKNVKNACHVVNCGDIICINRSNNWLRVPEAKATGTGQTSGEILLKRTPKGISPTWVKLSGKRTEDGYELKRAFAVRFSYRRGKMRSILTIIGEDKVGIIAKVSGALAQANVNILDLDQTVMREYFTMIMLVDMSAMTVSFEELRDKLDAVEKDVGLSIRVQREEIFKKMHEI